MKKCISLIAVLAILFTMAASALAAPAAEQTTLRYTLSANGAHEVLARPGDVITVSYQLSSSEPDTTVSVTQNEICYDHTFFELVEGSSRTSQGFEDYTVSLQERLDGKRYVYFNTLTTHTHGTAPQEIGTFQLRVRASEGRSEVKNVNSKAMDLDAVQFAASVQDLRVSVDTSAPTVQLSGTVTSFLDDSAPVKVELFRPGEAQAAYTAAAVGNSAAYTIPSVEPGTYTVRVSKEHHTPRTFTLTAKEGAETLDMKICPVGDATQDGQTVLADWMCLYDQLRGAQSLSGYALECADIIPDGAVGMSDWMRLYDHLNGSNPLW